jgi:HTH-type transcriptional regulator/antitoxin HigA
MDIRALRNEADLDWALAEVVPYFEAEPEPGTAEGERFEVLITLIEAYEDKHWAITTDVDPIAVIEDAINNRGKTRKDLAKILGVTTGRVSEILNKKRGLSIEMIRAISKAWKLPVELLIQPYKLKTATPVRTAARKTRVTKIVRKKAA